ncbi:MAG: hypothetical protein MJ102_07175 [Clostridia bacterium]|nr:hypothetical protein [Clostridia bacterium]
MEDAIDALVAGDTLTLLKDISTDCGFYPYVDGEFTIDGDGHTITADIANDGLFNLMGGVLTMKNIKIIYTETTSADGAKGAIIINSDCTATLEDVDISSKCNDVLLIKSKGILNINSGKYVIEDGNSVPYSNVIDAQGSSVVVINNGEFYRNDKGLTSVRAMVRLDKGSNITINNGYFFSATGRIIFSNGSSNKTFTINDGEFEIGADGAYTDPMFVLNQKITGTINGGTFTINSGSVDANGAATPMFNLGVKTAAITVTGGTFNNAEGNLLNVKCGTFKTGGGSFVNTLGKVIAFTEDYVEADTVIELYAGTIAYTANDDAAVIKGFIPSSSQVTDSGASMIITGVLPVETEPEAQPEAQPAA